ncbi:3'(2'),5'-bisphosphate nucleotidase CysQ [Deinococcus maricopensis]|uniref:Inositol monophosphatase n=1 Tax=Deinococcus maricopensis (strain DSM 21211 / LMG 22137 / NRRL B-23946 / LB-34) TaxID=709986 RepID=E8U8E5_DEIML|nr:3'(2'),5'-bisphosphate nucleotidase CysQ [Deinococcus maricopensis]ADV67334.1 inositol monophosphatase [Deinococcus maricopensis DSM 21211]
MTPPLSLHHELDVAVRLAREAGALLLHHRARDLQVTQKSSAEDLVTIADREASDLIVRALRAAFPEDGVLSEELADTPERLARERVWIIDPIDGTREYVNGSADFSVSIGLAVRGEATLGVVLAPATNELFAGVVGAGVMKNGAPVNFSDRPVDAAIIAVSDTEYRVELHRYALTGLHPSGSIALKLARIAAGEADATFTMSARSEWDIAAGMALVRANGGVTVRRSGSAIPLNAARPHIRRGLLSGRADVVAHLAQALPRAGVPEVQLGLRASDSAWAVLTPEQAARWSGHPHVHVRHAGGRVLALIALQPQADGWIVEHEEGDDFHLGRLARDLAYVYGPLHRP